MCISYLRNQPAADSMVQDIEKSGGKALAVAADVAVEADVLRLFETVDAKLGRAGAVFRRLTFPRVRS